MKFLCQWSSGGSETVRSGWGRVLNAMGHQFFWWNPETKPVFDAFSEIEPDVLLATTYDLDRAVYKCIKNRPLLKVGLYASAWGDLAESLDKEKYPIVRVRDDEKALVEKLKKETGQPEFVFVHVSDKFLGPTMGGWRSIGIRPEGILNAYDSLAYEGGQFDEALAADCAYIGSNWEYKGRNLDRFILPLCHPVGGVQTKIWGRGGWRVANYLGYLDDSRTKNVLASATVCPSVSEPHSTDAGFDTVERVFRVQGVGAFLVSDYVEEIDEIFGKDKVVMGKTPKEFADAIRHFIAHPDERLPYMKGGRQLVLDKNCYWHRVSKILSCLGLKDESERCLKVYEERFRPGNSYQMDASTRHK